MGKIGRNTPCPCGSGKKYKRCHGQLQSAPPTPLIEVREFDRLRRTLEAERIQRERQQGYGKPIISAEISGTRLIAIGETLHRSSKWKTFHDFLSDYLKLVFGKEWWMGEVVKPKQELHPVLLWAFERYEAEKKFVIEPGTIVSGTGTGATLAYMRLAYDLYCLAHNVELQSKLVGRLRSAEQFWGVRYEVFASAALVRAGFDVEFEDEDDRSTTHCEFTATCRKTGRSFSVEAKHRAGTRFRFGRQLNRALRKRARHERMIFLDINMPDAGSLKKDEAPQVLTRVLADIREVERRSPAGAPSAYLIITNTPSHHHLDSTSFREGALLKGFRIPDFKFDAVLPSVRVAVESRERHQELFLLGESLRDHSTIPATFDGEIPEFAFGQARQRLLVGNEYAVVFRGRERVGRLTSATVAEQDRRVVCALHFEDTDEAAIYEWPLSDAEMSAWRAHPDTFFGEPGQRRREARDPIELYEFFFESYSKTPKERLLEFMSDLPTIDALRTLGQPALAREYCIRLASAAYRSHLERANHEPQGQQNTD